MIKLPTFKDIRICYIISIAFMFMGGIPVIMYFINVNKFPAWFSSSFFIVLISAIFFLVGLTLFISCSMDKYKLHKLNYLKEMGSDEEVRQYENSFKQYVKLKFDLVMLLVPLALLIAFIGLLVYQVKKSANISTIIILVLPILFLVFVFAGLLYTIIKNNRLKSNKESNK